MSGYVESYRGQVLMRECDLLGHMNIQFYNARISQAMCHMFYLIGIDPADMKGGRRGLAAVHQESRYLAELRAGDIIHMESAVIGHSEKSISFDHRLYNSETGALAFINKMTSVYMDLERRKSVPLSEQIRRKITEIITEAEDAA